MIISRKITPFQQILQTEMSRLESLVYSQDRRIGGQTALTPLRYTQGKHTKSRHSLVHLLKYSLGLA